MTRNISWFSAAKKQNTLMDRRLLIRRYQERRWSHCNQKRASKQLNQLGQDCCPNAEVLTTDNSTKTQVANPGTLWGIPYMLPSFQFMFFSKLGTSPAPFEKKSCPGFSAPGRHGQPCQAGQDGGGTLVPSLRLQDGGTNGCVAERWGFTTVYQQQLELHNKLWE